MGLLKHIEKLYSRRILVELEPVSDLVAGPIASPSSATAPSQIGTIVQVADDTPTHLHTGLRVIISRYAGMDLNLEGEVGDDRQTFKLCTPQDVIMRLAHQGSKQQLLEEHDVPA